MNPKCPKCGGEMAWRSGKYGPFWGCKKFPLCKGISKAKGGKKKNYKIEKIPYQPRQLDEYQQAIISKVATQTQNVLKIRYGKTSSILKSYQAVVVKPNELGIAPTLDSIGEVRNILVNSMPGSGKTTLLVEAAELVLRHAPTLDVCFACFGANMRDELKARVPDRANRDVFSINQLGLKDCSANWRSKTVPNKLKVALWEYNDKQQSKEDKVAGGMFSAVVKAITLLKQNLWDPNYENCFRVMGEYDLEIPGNDLPTWVALVEHFYALSLGTTEVDFTDQYALPVLLNAPPAKLYDVILGDEVQDWSTAQWELVKRHVKPDGFVVLVGDQNQAIFGWRGAGDGMMARMQADTAAFELPMNVCYRCPSHAIEFAAALVPEITARPDAPYGEVLDVYDEGELVDWLVRVRSALVQSRKNAPLAKLWHLLIRNGATAFIRGRDILETLDRLLAKYHDAANLEEFIALYRADVNVEVGKLRAAGPKAEKRIESITDTFETVLVLSEGLKTIAELKERFDSVYDDVGKAGIVLSTTYRAKGDQHARNVIMHGDDYNQVWGSGDRAIREQVYVLFVAITRTQNVTVFYDGRPEVFQRIGSRAAIVKPDEAQAAIEEMEDSQRDYGEKDMF